MKDIETINELRAALENDTSSHRIKDLAKLFLDAMTTWPTFNQTKIIDFVQELKDFYGHPLTLAKIDNKNIDVNQEQDVWRYEAATSIAEILDISTRFDNDSDFDNILKRLLDYYKQFSLCT